MLAGPQPLGAHWGYDSCIPCWCSWRDVRGVGEAGKLSLLGSLLHLRGTSRLTTLAHPYILVPHPLFSPHLLPYAWTKKKRGAKKERVKRKRGIGRKTQVL
jgi:hypothetical protein